MVLGAPGVLLSKRMLSWSPLHCRPLPCTPVTPTVEVIGVDIFVYVRPAAPPCLRKCLALQALVGGSGSPGMSGRTRPRATGHALCPTPVCAALMQPSSCSELRTPILVVAFRVSSVARGRRCLMAGSSELPPRVWAEAARVRQCQSC